MDQDLKEHLDQALRKIDERLIGLSNEIKRYQATLEGKHDLRPRFVEASPEVRTYVQQIDRLIAPTRGPPSLKNEILIMGYFDNIRLDKLLPYAYLIKLLCREDAKDRPTNLDALKRIKKAGAQVKTNKFMHSRMFCVPDRRFLIIGSGDLQADCFGAKRYDAGIYTTHPQVLKDAVDYFNRVWEESTPFSDS